MAHATTLRQVLVNLISNAVKFVAAMPPQVRLHAEERPGGYVRIWVEDNGIGIPAEFQEKIFNVFQRLHTTEYAGTGIGLAIVQKGAERMGGRAGLESAPRLGSKFWIELARAPAGTPAPRTKQRNTMMIEDPIVLLVDDSKNDAMLMRTVFERAGFVQPMRLAVDGDDAIAYLRGDGRYGDRKLFPLPTTVLLDLNMPRKDGFEVLDWIRPPTRAAPPARLYPQHVRAAPRTSNAPMTSARIPIW